MNKDGKSKLKKTSFLSRRNFIATSGLALAGTALSLKSAGILGIANEKPEPIIDVHQHSNYMGRYDKDYLTAHQRNMGVTTTILLPAGRSVISAATHKGFSNGLECLISGNEVTYRFAKEHPKEFLFGACEVPDLSGAVQEIEKYLKLGAVVIGELKFGVECDSPEMQKIYQLAQEYDVPVLMHWQYQMYNYGIERFHTMLEKFPKVNFIAHAQEWWGYIDKNYVPTTELYPKGKITPGGLADRLLSDYPNQYADFSATSGQHSLTRDEDHARKFLEHHQDKLLFGSDCPDPANWDGEIIPGSPCQAIHTIAEIRKLSATKKIERKILYGNAKKLFKI